MKIKLAIIIGCLGVLLGGYAFACGDCGNEESSNSCGAASCPYDTECECTDPGVNQRNPCLSRCEYCEAFGNVGAR